MILSCYDLPANFIRQYSPLRIHPLERGARAYLFDPFGLDFFRSAVTAEPVPAASIWSIVLPGEQPVLMSGERGEAIGFVVTEEPRPLDYHASMPLPKRLTYRQRVRLAVLRELQEELLAEGVHAESLGGLTDRLRLAG